jgi:ABC-type multidrug transport system fused ATPase/permease subunit
MADLIAVIDHGQLTEYGTDRELMTVHGLYAPYRRAGPCPRACRIRGSVLG